MALTLDEVRHIARLARVALSPDEEERLQGELSAILAHCEALSAFDTSEVQPTAQSFDLSNVERADEPRPSAERDLVLRNAPRSSGGYLRVRAVLDDGSDAAPEA